MKTWWAGARDVFLNLTRIGLPAELVNKSKKHRLWSMVGYELKLLDDDVMLHGDELEEQLWAKSLGLGI